jgi:hypothetical protein
MVKTKPLGRPEIYTQELANIICRRISEGESVRTICKDEDMPDAGTIYNWLLDETKELFFKQYTRARDVQAEVLFEEIIELADSSLTDIVGDDKSDSARVQARKLQIDARHWHLSKLRPRKYGDKLDLTSGGEKLPTPIMSLGTGTDALQRNDSNEKDKESQ